MSILVTGAAGYIGSIVTEELIKRKNAVVAIDNLKQGHREAVSPEASFIEADLKDADSLARVFRDYHIEVVMHLAADSQVGESMANPGKYFQNNVVCGINLLDTMLKYDVNQLIFSSSAAIYGNPREIPISEDHLVNPVNPYGESKLIFQKILKWYGHAFGLRSVSLCYFNAAGASERYGEHHEPETHLIPNILKVALGQRDYIPVYGTDYSTEDGTCVRDYIHVRDIAEAHIHAMEYLKKKRDNPHFNLGNGKGYSINQVIEVAMGVTGVQIPKAIHPRRAGDPAILVASSDLAKSKLGWEPKYRNLDAIVESAWRWQKAFPNGYIKRGKST